MYILNVTVDVIIYNNGISHLLDVSTMLCLKFYDTDLKSSLLCNIIPEFIRHDKLLIFAIFGCNHRFITRNILETKLRQLMSKFVFAGNGKEHFLCLCHFLCNFDNSESNNNIK